MFPHQQKMEVVGSACMLLVCGEDLYFICWEREEYRMTIIDEPTLTHNHMTIT